MQTFLLLLRAISILRNVQQALTVGKSVKVLLKGHISPIFRAFSVHTAAELKLATKRLQVIIMLRMTSRHSFLLMQSF